ncbi:MAG: hypothetical protein V7644_675 [Actinomycetota bacterium]
MPSWGWIVIAAIVVVLLVAFVVSRAAARRRSSQLQGRFGPEYDRTVESADNRKKAEAELAARQERREQLHVRPLSPAARERYLSQWQTAQAQFVDTPGAAVAAADELIQSAMAERGYPVQDFDSRAADISVDHPQVVENYRHGHRLAEKAADGNGSTEDLRQAMRHYRALFEELIEPVSDEPVSRGRDEEVAAETESDGAVRRGGSAR